MRYAEKLYKHMLLKGLNQQKLARLSSVSDSEVSRILKGKSNPSLEYAFRLSQALGISLDYLADDRLDENAQTGPELSPVEAEVLELVRQFDPRQARRILETAMDLGYEVAIRRLLGTEMKPIIEVGSSPPNPENSAPASSEGRINRASSA